MSENFQVGDRRRSGNGRLSISYSTIGVIGSILAMLIALVTIGSKIATKEDVASIKAAISPVLDQHDSRIRSLELQMASHFGASPASSRPVPSSTEKLDIRQANFVLAQYIPQIPDASGNQPSIRQTPIPLPARRVVVPMAMVKEYMMEPTRGGSYALLGEDGRFYAVDDVLAIIIRKLRLGEQKVK